MTTNKNFSKFRIDIAVIITFTILFSIFCYNFAILNISGSSMSPTYTNGQFILLKRNREPQNGDLIVFDPPEEWGSGNYKFLKRIVGKHSDEIVIDNKEIIVNGLSSPHGETQCNPIHPNIKLSKGEFLVAGDNIGNSNDGVHNYCIGSENFKVKKEDVVVAGKSIFVIGGIAK